MSLRTSSLAALAALALAPGAPLSLEPEEAKALGGALTAVGAERAGNADGTIPPYTGGLTTPPAGFDPASGSRPDPFASERPLFSVDARNLDAHAARLTEGLKALMRRYPDFRIDVYPTHRTVAFPPFVTGNTVRLATSARTANGGVSLVGVRAAYPFPIPKTGNEAMWNDLVRFIGSCTRKRTFAYYVEGSGAVTLTSSAYMFEDYPYWDAKRAGENIYFRIRISYDGPPRQAGAALMLVDPVNYEDRGRRGWQYMPGQRRVRVAPDLSYDTPNAATRGAQTFDDALLFNGEMDRYDFALVGKREMYVPYNAYRAVYQASPERILKPHHLDPDLVRFELHRVWVVDARLKPGKRHIYSRRVIYLDEDSWAALLSDQYDVRGQLYRVQEGHAMNYYNLPSLWTSLELTMDLSNGRYLALNLQSEEPHSYDFSIKRTPADYQPGLLERRGIR